MAIGFREQGDQRKSSLTWNSRHRDNPRREESLMITGDGNLVEIQANIRFRISEPRAYLFGANNPDEIVRVVGESVLRRTVAGKNFHDLLTIYRSGFQDEVLARLKERLADYQGLGISVEGISLLDLHPPSEVVGEYYLVAQAMEKHDQTINEAEGLATRKMKDAEAQSAQDCRPGSRQCHGKDQGSCGGTGSLRGHGRKPQG